MTPRTLVATVAVRRGWPCGARALRGGQTQPRRGLCSVALPERGGPAGQLCWGLGSPSVDLAPAALRLAPSLLPPGCWAAQGAEDGGSPRGCSEYELSVGKIADTLQKDYPAIFEREPDFSVYQEHVLFALGQPFHVQKVVDYHRALSSLRRLGNGVVKDAKVHCQVCDGKAYGYALRVYWRCVGMSYMWTPLNISAVSFYSVEKEMPCADENESRLPYRISRHVIEFTEINPPTIRSLLQNLWWRRQVDQRGPVLALRPVPSLSAAASLPRRVEFCNAGCFSAAHLRRSYHSGDSAHGRAPPPTPGVACQGTLSPFASWW